MDIHLTYEIGCGPGEGNHMEHPTSDYAFEWTLFADGLGGISDFGI
jgi:hypothetical protein